MSKHKSEDYKITAVKYLIEYTSKNNCNIYILSYRFSSLARSSYKLNNFSSSENNINI